MAANGLAKCSAQEFIDIWNRLGGNASEMSRVLRCTESNLYKRRRRIERDHGVVLRGNGFVDRSSDPAPEFPDWQHVEIKNGLLVAFSDSHLIPHRKSTAHKALIKLVGELQPDVLVDMGDLLDFASISKHHRIGWDRQLSVREEVEWARDCLEELTQAGPKKMRRRRTRGNHDQRFAGHISNNLSSYEGLRGLTLEDQLPDWPVSWALRVNEDQLEIKHRWKGGVHAPFNNTKESGLSYATGHLHSQKVMPFTDARILNGGQSDRWGTDVGTLASIYGPHFRYREAAPRDWRSGFAVFRFVDYKLRHPQLVRVVDDKKGVVEYLGKDIQI